MRQLRNSSLGLVAGFLLFGCGGQTVDWTLHDGYRSRPLEITRGRTGFKLLSAEETGLTIVNGVSSDTIVANSNFMHGSGIALGDVDQDGYPDIFVGRLTAPDVLYRNLGDWQFEDVTAQSGLPILNYATTGAVLVDIDGDRDLDLLLTMLMGPNAVYLNDGQGQFIPAFNAAGLQSSHASTTMTLADVDGDADLDLYVARYKRIALADSLPPELLTWENVLADTAWGVKPEFSDHYRFRTSGSHVIRSELGEPDALYLNDGQGVFQLKPWSEGLFLDASGQPVTHSPRHWGLTAHFHNVNGDQIPDLYVCNDFDSPDRFYLGQEGGRFRHVPPEAVRQTSNATMSIGFSDINRDGHMDFFLTDMLSRSHAMRQRQRNTRIPEESSPGDLMFVPQEMQNMLMLGRGDDTWAGISHLAGVAASGWSWATTFLDVDLDGYEDILVTTGHAFDVQDLDAQAWQAQEMLQERSWQRARRTILRFPTLSLPNVAFRNRGDLTFEDMAQGWGFGESTDVAHGMALADLDLDGDLDVVTNRLNDTPGVYRNTVSADRLAVRLYGNAPNTAGVGSSIHVTCPGLPDQQKEITAGGMYLSGSQMQVSFAATRAPCSIEVHWRAGTRSIIAKAQRNHLYEVLETGAEPTPDHSSSLATTQQFALTRSLPPPTDEVYDDFARQPLLPWHLSRYSPAVVLYDLDADSLDDVIIGGGQNGRTTMHTSRTGLIELEPLPGDVTSMAIAPTRAGIARLFAASSNYERDPINATDSSWVYVHDIDPDGRWRRHSRLLFGRSTPGPVSLFDVDEDGDLDLFVGGHFVPGRYPEPASSTIFVNEDGQYVADSLLSRPFEKLGNVRSSVFGDVDSDGDMDAVLGLEWGPIRVLTREGHTFVDRTRALGLSSFSGWWRGVALGDFDSDGQLDIASANAGWNTRFGRDGQVRLNYADLDANGLMDIFESSAGLPTRNLIELASAVPPLQMRFSTHRSFSVAMVSDLWPDLDRNTRVVEATTLGSAVFLNRGNHFEMRALPVEAQLSTSAAIAVLDANLDGHEDLVLGQNWFALPLITPRQDAGRTLLLLGQGTGQFVAVDGGFRVYGEARSLAVGDMNNDARPDLVVSQHSAPAHMYLSTSEKAGLQVWLNGSPNNLSGIGASVRVEYFDGTLGPVRLPSASQQNPQKVIMGLAKEPARIHVEWPGGVRSRHAIAPGQRRLSVSPNE